MEERKKGRSRGCVVCVCVCVVESMESSSRHAISTRSIGRSPPLLSHCGRSQRQVLLRERAKNTSRPEVVRPCVARVARLGLQVCNGCHWMSILPSFLGALDRDGRPPTGTCLGVEMVWVHWKTDWVLGASCWRQRILKFGAGSGTGTLSDWRDLL